MKNKLDEEECDSEKEMEVLKEVSDSKQTATKNTKV